MTESLSIAEAWRDHRPYLVNLAYQMLGDIGHAEDVTQEAFLRLSRVDDGSINDMRGWLTVVTGRLCLDHVRSAQSRYESPGDTNFFERTGAGDPADRVTLDDQISGALLEVMRRLSPPERVAFVLHDVFKVPFDEISETVGRPVGTCRQLARRARLKVQAAQPARADIADHERRAVTERFITACANGDLAALTAVLDPTVWGVATLLGDPTPPPRVNHGPHDVAVNLLCYVGVGATLVSGPAGQPVLLGYARRRLFAILVLTVSNGRVTKIEATADPSARFD